MVDMLATSVCSFVSDRELNRQPRAVKVRIQDGGSSPLKLKIVDILYSPLCLFCVEPKETVSGKVGLLILTTRGTSLVTKSSPIVT